MIRERQYVFLRLNLLVDVALAMLALVAAYYTRSLIALAHASLAGAAALPAWIPEIAPYEESHLFFEYLWLFPACAVLWPLALNRFGYYDLYDLRHSAQRCWMIVKACVLATVFLMTLIFVAKQQFIARIVVVGIGAWAAVFLLVKERIARTVFIRLHERPENQLAVLLVGEGTRLATASEIVGQYREWGVRVERQMAFAGLTPDTLSSTIIAQPVNEVVFAVESASLDRLGDLVRVCELLGVRTRIFLDIYRPEISKPAVEILNGVPLLTLQATTQNVAGLTVKLFFDRAASLVLLIILSPLMLAVSAAIAAMMGMPVLIRQVRCGLNGKPFVMLKFRTMVPDADKIRAQLEERNELEGWAFKIKDDPRVTPLGRFLRRFSLDELPQLWNVLRGDMSLVGPRPALPGEVARFDLWERRRLSMLPGITGLWQVSGRTRLPNEQWVRYDLAYIDSWSLKNDARILLKTLWAVLRGEGM
ncbi:sugar transferase [bacterium]|nr:sugar transferase [bacterium]